MRSDISASCAATAQPEGDEAMLGEADNVSQPLQVRPWQHQPQASRRSSHLPDAPVLVASLARQPVH